MERNKHLESELQNKEELRNKYAHHITKLENKCRDSTTLVKNLEKDKVKLSEEVQKLENDNMVMATKITEMEEMQREMESELKSLEEELDKRTYEYVCRIQDLEAMNAQYAKELKKPVNMFVTGRSPFRDRLTNDPAPTQPFQYLDQYSKAVDMNIHKGTDQTISDTTLTAHNKGIQSVTTGRNDADNQPNGHKRGQDRSTMWKPKMTPHMTSLHPGVSRCWATSTGAPLNGLQITSGSCVKPCKPVVSTASLSPRAKPTGGKTFTKKH